MLDTENATRFSVGKAILFGGLAAGVLDAADAMVAFKLVLGFDPIPVSYTHLTLPTNREV